MKKNLLFIVLFFAFSGMLFGQTTLVDFETVRDPLVEPFDLASYENGVANPDKSGINTSDYVGKAVKTMTDGDIWGFAFWGGINIYFGGDIEFTGTNDKFAIDFYTEDAGTNDTILFRFELFNRYGGVETISVDTFYVGDDTQVGVWKTLEYDIPDGTTGSYNQAVIFFGWTYSANGDTYYYDNIVAPGYQAYGNTDVTFNITDKFDNAEDIKLFVEGSEETLTKTGNSYTTTLSLASYNVTVGQSVGSYEVVYSHVANGEEIRDTTSIFVGNSAGEQEVLQLIIVEEPEDGTALAIDVGDTPPVIDGTIDEVWSNAKTHTLQERGWWGTPTGLYSTFKIMWDVDNLYLLYTIEDDTPYGENVDAVYQNDNMETFLDMNQSATTPYDSDDWQIRTIRGKDSWTGSANVTADWASNLSRAQEEMEGNAGYIIEMAIPWTSLSSAFLPIAGTEFNFDCSASDVGTGGGARLYRESWVTAEDIAYLNTKDFGTITLSELTDETTGISSEQLDAFNLSIYPNPANKIVHVQSDVEITNIRLMDMSGRSVKQQNSINQFRTTVDLSELSSGLYLISIENKEGKFRVEKVRVL